MLCKGRRILFLCEAAGNMTPDVKKDMLYSSVKETPAGKPGSVLLP
jgi:hypothetical protein